MLAATREETDDAKALRRLKQRPRPRRGARQRAGRMAGRKHLKINGKPRPAAKPRGGAPIQSFQRPAIRRGHSPAGGALNVSARAP